MDEFIHIIKLIKITLLKFKTMINKELRVPQTVLFFFSKNIFTYSFRL